MHYDTLKLLRYDGGDWYGKEDKCHGDIEKAGILTRTEISAEYRQTQTNARGGS